MVVRGITCEKCVKVTLLSHDSTVHLGVFVAKVV